jgi:hypothetical protein
LGIVNVFIPSIIIILSQLLFSIAGFYCLTNKQQLNNNKILRALLLIQSFQICILGYWFKNYFGPYLGIGFFDNPNLHFKNKFQVVYFFI